MVALTKLNLNLILMVLFGKMSLIKVIIVITKRVWKNIFLLYTYEVIRANYVVDYSTIWKL